MGGTRSKESFIKECLEAANKNMCIYVEELIAFVSFSKRTFYNHRLHEVHAIIETIQKNRINLKSGLRRKMFDSRSAHGHIALYKLLGTKEERIALGMQVTTKETPPEPTISDLDVEKLDLDEQIALAQLIEKASKKKQNELDGSQSDIEDPA